MKKILSEIIVFVFLIFGFSNYARSQESDSAGILQLENDWTKALVNRDENIVNKALSENFIYTENDKNVFARRSDPVCDVNN